MVIAETAPPYGGPPRPADDDMPERALWRLWQKRAARQQEFRTSQGRRVRVLFPGRPGVTAGPDFRAALLEIEGLGLVRGDVEIHRRADDWDAHGHTDDPNYSGVALHAALEPPGADAAPATPRPGGGGEIPLISLTPLLSPDAAADQPDAAAGTAAADLRELDRLSDRQLYVVVNARAEIGAERLQRLLDRAAAAPGGGAAVTVIRSAAFHPAAPQPAALRARAAGPRTPASDAPAPP